MPETIKTKVGTYTMKMQIYPSEAQKKVLDSFFRALHIAYNITFHEVFQKNEKVCKKPNKNGDVWPDYRKMASADWRHYLIECNPAVGMVSSDALLKNNGLFLKDAKKAWENGMANRPVDAASRKDFHFYNSAKPRRSFTVQIHPYNLVPSPDNPKVVWVTVPKVKGKIKARGFNRKLWFGKGGEHTYEQAFEAGELAKLLTVCVSKDTCGSYYVSVRFTADDGNGREQYLETPVRDNTEPVGIDVGIKDVAILSSGEKTENKHFKKEKDKTLRRLNRQLSRRWGPSNMAYRDYNRAIREENRAAREASGKNADEIPLSKPSNRYLAAQRKKALIERRISRKRDTYYQQETARIARKSSLIAIETLHVKNMLRNHKLAYALSDAAMSDFLSKLKYKAERFGIEVKTIGMFEPSSQLCSVCGEQNPKVKSLSVRQWTCPKCGTKHDRDVNAAKNILKIALNGGTPEDKEAATPAEKKKTGTRPPGRVSYKSVSADTPEIQVIYSKELSKTNDARYIIINTKTHQIIDDAQGAGFRSLSNAKNSYKAKKKWSEKAKSTNK